MEPPETTMRTLSFRAFAPPQILSVAAPDASKSAAGAQDDNASGFEEPVRVYEVAWQSQR